MPMVSEVSSTRGNLLPIDNWVCFHGWKEGIFQFKLSYPMSCLWYLPVLTLDFFLNIRV